MICVDMTTVVGTGIADTMVVPGNVVTWPAKVMVLSCVAVENIVLVVVVV